MFSKLRTWFIISGVATAGIFFYAWTRGTCVSVRMKHGISIPECPSGEMRLQVGLSAANLRRGGTGTVDVSAAALYTLGPADSWSQAPLSELKASLTLEDKAGKETKLAVKKWKQVGDSLRGELELPKVDDGDYTLRASIKTPLGSEDAEIKLPLYAPARIHLLTDRPLYEPGNTVRFRAVVLRASDLSPIDRRPGRWVVTDPQGETLLDESADAGEWGVVAGSFPLDALATHGNYKVSFRSGKDSGEQFFKVEPFTLPRFSVEASSTLPFYRAGDSPKLSGIVRYSSGAPVQGATLRVQWSSQGQWPMPTRWLESELPRSATSDDNGRFSLQLPVIPQDLQGQATLRARISAIDPAGDRVETSASVLLSQDGIAVSAVTEFGGGLVENANNRVFLRVTTADGRPLPGAEVSVKKAWAPRDPGSNATLDEDGVGRVQLDPGAPVNVVIPAMPVRRSARTKQPSVVRIQAHDMIANAAISLDDQAALDKLTSSLASCSRWSSGNENIEAVAEIATNGQARSIIPRLELEENDAGQRVARPNPLAECAVKRLRTARLSAGAPRMLRLRYQFRDSGLPRLNVDFSNASASSEMQETVQRAALASRACLPSTFEGQLGWPMRIRLSAGKKAIDAAWISLDGKARAPQAVTTCIANSLRGLSLRQSAASDMLGLIRFSITQPGKTRQRKPRPTIMRGYELRVSARAEGLELGTTLLRLSPGTVPDLRIRPSEVLAKAGSTVELELVRGPNFRGKVPKELEVRHRGKNDKLKVDTKARKASFEIPADAKGWFEFRSLGQRALVFVADENELTVALKPDQERYAPGSEAELALTTKLAGKGQQAAVGLFGIDSTMAQLAPLPGTDAMQGLRPPVTMSAKAFNVLDGQALVNGRIRGRAAAEATVLRVNSIPLPDEIEVAVSAYAQSNFDPAAELTLRFYEILAELHGQTLRWQISTKKGQEMSPKIMAKLWKQAVAAVEKRGGNVKDAFGRRLRLSYLPDDLLVLTDPRQVVTDATRLPEDVENWTEWVRRNQP